MESRERNVGNGKKKVEKSSILISYEHAENSHSRAKWTRNEFGYNLKGKMKIDFAWPCENFAQSYEMLQEGEIGSDAFSTVRSC